MPSFGARFFRQPVLIAGALVAISLASCSPSNEPPEVDGTPDKRAAYQRFWVDLGQQSLMTGDKLMTPLNAERYCKTLQVMLKSPRVIEAALRSAEASGYSLYPKDESTTVEWLQEQLEVSMPEGSEVLVLSFPHPSAPKQEMLGIVRAVSKAFFDEIVFEENLRRKKPRDLLAACYQDLDEEIQRKDQRLQALLEEEPCVLLPGVAEEVELMKQQSSRLQAEKIRVDRELWNRRIAAMAADQDNETPAQERGDVEDSYAKIKEGLQQQIDELADAMKRVSQIPPEVRARADELATLREVRNEIGKQIEYFAVELRLPEPVRLAGGVDFVDP